MWYRTLSRYSYPCCFKIKGSAIVFLPEISEAEAKEFLQLNEFFAFATLEFTVVEFGVDKELCAQILVYLEVDGILPFRIDVAEIGIVVQVRVARNVLAQFPVVVGRHLETEFMTDALARVDTIAGRTEVDGVHQEVHTIGERRHQHRQFVLAVLAVFLEVHTDRNEELRRREQGT